eukprot:gnl/TRDRNA2_/TRDRNA2_44251_c0_seq1.p1 gnl/TRDRNA2_/TRDRNA2_44251_c0~~gnl/TRDRNA2_/TRDRNA2_44251_c0_seq1.p1  ORF type:complete len:123 (-),score=20.74 gnl/TRDRNA2_/TRDRNA2_44251_c0_seq1:71-439(-)
MSSSIASPHAAHSVTGAAEARLQYGAGLDSTSMTMLQFMFAVVFAAVALGVMSYMGFAPPTSAAFCPSCDGYSGCAMLQDFRSIASFVLGALLCCFLTRNSPEQEAVSRNDGEKVQLYAYML